MKWLGSFPRQKPNLSPNSAKAGIGRSSGTHERLNRGHGRSRSACSSVVISHSPRERHGTTGWSSDAATSALRCRNTGLLISTHGWSSGGNPTTRGLQILTETLRWTPAPGLKPLEIESSLVSLRRCGGRAMKREQGTGNREQGVRDQVGVRESWNSLRLSLRASSAGEAISMLTVDEGLYRDSSLCSE